MRIFALIVGCALVFNGSAGYGATYEWTDGRGGVHFTDDPASIPPKFRATARERESLGGEPAPAQPREAETPPPAEPSSPTAGQYGGRPLSWWQDTYRALKREEENLRSAIEQLKDKFAVERRKKAVFQRAKDRQAINQTREGLEKAEAALEGNAKNQVQLADDAARAGLPANWREAPRP